MAANRKPFAAPHTLLYLSKATLADLVWELAALSPDCTSCDEPPAIWKALCGAVESFAERGSPFPRADVQRVRLGHKEAVQAEDPTRAKS